MWRANRVWSSPINSSAVASGIRSPLILNSNDCLKNADLLIESLSDPWNVPGALTLASGRMT